MNANAQMARESARGLHPIEIAASGLPSALRELCSGMSGDVSRRCDCPRFSANRSKRGGQPVSHRAGSADEFHEARQGQPDHGLFKRSNGAIV